MRESKCFTCGHVISIDRDCACACKLDYRLLLAIAHAANAVLIASRFGIYHAKRAGR